MPITIFSVSTVILHSSSPRWQESHAGQQSRHPQGGPGAREDPVIPSLSDLPSPQLCGMKLRGAAAACPRDSVCDMQLWVRPGPGREARLTPAPEPSNLVCVCSPWSRETPGEREAIRPRCALRTQEQGEQGACSRAPRPWPSRSLVRPHLHVGSCLARLPPVPAGTQPQGANLTPQSPPRTLCPCKL